MAAYYNEIDSKTAAWLRELIKAGLIADGEVDERSIADVQPADLTGFAQCHFFAGIGGWSYALRLAGWSDDRRVWTGSCPCQPFSTAGKALSAADPRHLWPSWFRLIRECAPPVVFGEQVASIDGLAWLDLVYADLEAANYAVGAVDLCAAGIGAPHIRQRLWIVAHAIGAEWWARAEGRRNDEHGPNTNGPKAHGRRAVDRQAGALDEPERQRAERTARSKGRAECQPQGGREDEGRRRLQTLNSGADGDVGHANSTGYALGTWQPGDDASTAGTTTRQAVIETGATRGAWGCADWLYHEDGKYRPVEPGTFPLAHGLPARVGRLRGYGNAIVPQVAAEVIGAYMDLCDV